MHSKRLRVFAVPNGFGKTTIVNNLRSQISFGVYVNADAIEQGLKSENALCFSDHRLNISQESLQHYFKGSTFSPVKREEPDLWKKLLVTKNTCLLKTLIDSYLATDLAFFIRQEKTVFCLQRWKTETQLHF